MTSARLLVVAISLGALSPFATAADHPASTSPGAALTYARFAADLFCPAVSTVSSAGHWANGEAPVASVATCLFDVTPFSELVTLMRRAGLRMALGSAGIPVITALRTFDDAGPGGQHQRARAGGPTSPLPGLAPTWSPTLSAWLLMTNLTGAPLAPTLWVPAEPMEAHSFPSLDAPILAVPLPL